MATLLRADWLAPFVFFVVAGARLAFLLVARSDQLVAYAPDDAFYYLQAARNFAETGRWTFDGIEPSSGFHILHGYLLALGALLADTPPFWVVFFIVSAGQILVLTLAIWLIVRTLRNSFGIAAGLAAVAIFGSAAVLHETTFLMEGPLVVLFAALGLRFLHLDDPRPLTPRSTITGILIGIGLTFARSDAGLVAAGLVAAALIARERRGILRGAVVLGGAVIGLGLMLLNTLWISDGASLLQASAREKSWWNELAGPSFAPILNTLTGVFNFQSGVPPTLAIKAERKIGLLDTSIGLIVAGLVIGLIIATALAWRKRSAEGASTARFDRSRGLVIAMLAVVAGYVIFYRSNSQGIQPWYIANFIVPMTIVTAAGIDTVARQGRAWRAVVAGLAVCAVLWGAMTGYKPIWPHQLAMQEAGVELRDAPTGQTFGAWNAGILGYFSEGRVVNLDGLMNDSIYEHSINGTLAEYIAGREIDAIVDFPLMFEWLYPARGGYANGVLTSCMTAAPFFANEAPDRTWLATSITRYSLDRACLEASR